MQQENNRQSTEQKDKAAPQHIASGSEEKTKQKTNPLDKSDSGKIDKDEGEMNNGEIGSGLRKDN